MSRCSRQAKDWRTPALAAELREPQAAQRDPVAVDCRPQDAIAACPLYPRSSLRAAGSDTARAERRSSTLANGECVGADQPRKEESANRAGPVAGNCLRRAMTATSEEIRARTERTTENSQQKNQRMEWLQVSGKVGFRAAG